MTEQKNAFNLILQIGVESFAQGQMKGLTWMSGASLNQSLLPEAC